MSLHEHKRVLTIVDVLDSTEALKVRVRELFKDVLKDVLKDAPNKDFYLQLKDESWGEWVDLIDQPIEDHSFLRLQFLSQVCFYLILKGS